MPDRRLRRSVTIIAAALVAAAAAVTAVALWPAPAGRAADATPAPAAEPAPSPSPSPTQAGYPADDATYDVAGLPATEVFSVIPGLPTDDDPFGDPTGLVAQASGDAAPVFAEPGGDPVAVLPREQRYGGTTVPVVERQEHWLKVLVAGRQGLPGSGDPSQAIGWVRAGDVAVTENAHRVDVDLAAGTIAISGAGEREAVAGPFAWGAAATPTAVGRSFIMLNETVAFDYTRGHPMVYLSVQSPTLAGFDGQDQATIAFHYHDAHEGAISNGCLRLGAEAIDRIAQLPLGTPVYVHGADA
ncbi:L,D-transpeptidase [Microbacterium indicum]|uniref:L,D-transpeptidase n=1 Tax=Microbacterium indicum TaxID=358100 RepID=UPI0004274D06|nr:L,D-transpeptidase [Microbacterium indicum]